MSSRTLLGLSLLLSGGTVQAESLTVTLPITSVTVYQDRALVSRAAPVSIGRGASRLVLEGLPATLSEPSVRASIEGPAGTRVVAVSTRVVEQPEASNEKVREAEREVERLERALAALQSDDAALGRETKAVSALQEMARQAVSENATLALADPLALARIADFFPQRLERIGGDRRELALRMEKVQTDLSDARANLNKLSRRSVRSERAVSLDVEAAAPVQPTVTISYIVSNCGWTPRYDARLVSQSLRVTYQGEIRQKSGEDWSNVTLALSTARPALGARRPDLLPLRMYTAAAAPPPKSVTSRYEEAKLEEAVIAAETAGEEIAPPMETPEITTTVETTGTSVSFLVPNRCDIPADGRSHKVSITSFDDPSPKLSYETIPSLQRTVFLRCDSTNRSAFPLLAGPVDVWRESGFVGTSSIAFVAPKGAVLLSFGSDDDLKVKRVIDPARTKETTNGSKRERRSAFEIEVANYKPEPVDVLVRERIPVSDVEEVQVEIDPSTTQRTESDTDKGLLMWKLTLQPGAKNRIRLEYAVRMPRDFAWIE